MIVDGLPKEVRVVYFHFSLREEIGALILGENRGQRSLEISEVNFSLASHWTHIPTGQYFFYSFLKPGANTSGFYANQWLCYPLVGDLFEKIAVRG